MCPIGVIFYYGHSDGHEIDIKSEELGVHKYIVYTILDLISYICSTRLWWWHMSYGNCCLLSNLSAHFLCAVCCDFICGNTLVNNTYVANIGLVGCVAKDTIAHCQPITVFVCKSNTKAKNRALICCCRAQKCSCTKTHAVVITIFN